MAEVTISDKAAQNYLSGLTNKIFKILPMKEEGEKSLYTYIKSLRLEIAGCSELPCIFAEDEKFIAILGILQYLNENECDTQTTKREVFKCISLCKKLEKKYGKRGDSRE